MSENVGIENTKFIVETKLDPKHEQHGWLSPQGAFITCKPDEHDVCAQYVVSLNTNYFKDKLGADYDDYAAREVLSALGYVQISGAYPDFYNALGNITSEQYKLLTAAGFDVPEALTLDTSKLLPSKEDAAKKLETKYPTEEFSDLLNKFYLDPFNGLRTSNLELGEDIFNMLSSQNVLDNKIESSRNSGIMEVSWKELGEGRVALGKEKYHHEGDSPRDYDAPWDNVTIFVNTSEYIKNRIPLEYQKK